MHTVKNNLLCPNYERSTDMKHKITVAREVERKREPGSEGEGKETGTREGGRKRAAE